MASFNLSFEPNWIVKNIDDGFITYVDKLGLFLCDKEREGDNLGYNAITVTQLRNIFSEVKRIEQKMLNFTRIPSDLEIEKLDENKRKELFDKDVELEKLDENKRKEIFDKIEKEKPTWYSDFLMLKVKLAYSTGRVLEKNRNSNMKKFSEIMTEAMKSVKEPNHFDNFVKFFEAVIAFHKVYGGKDNEKKR